MTTTEETTLRPHQRANTLTLSGVLRQHRIALDSSEAGTGKSHTALAVAVALGLEPFIICPLSVGPGWVAKAHTAFPNFAVHWTNYEKARRRGWLATAGLDPAKHLIIFDEAHRLKSPTTLQSQLSKAVADAGFKQLWLSATPYSSPLDTRAFLHAAGLARWGDFYHVIRNFGCRRATWLRGSPWIFQGGDNYLALLRDELRPFSVKTRWSELPNHVDHVVTVERLPLSAKSRREVDAAWDAIHMELGDLVKHRVLLEQHRVPGMVEMAKDALAEGRSVVAFFNYTAPLYDFASHFDAMVIDGKTHSGVRQVVLNEFQTSPSPCVLAGNSRAMGEGIDAHDIVGVPRTTLISPSDDPVVMTQVLGRVRRDGSLSVPVQRICTLAETYEEHIAARCAVKIDRIETLTAEDLS